MAQDMVVRNERGEKIVLNSREKLIAERNQKIANSLGFEVPITTLTTILKSISEQRFFEIAFADYLPVLAGEGAWSSNLEKFRSFELSGQFEEGILNLGSNNSRLASADAGVDALSVQVFDWAKNISWSIPQLEKAAKNNNWDLITAKSKSLKKNWDLGLQKVAFLGAAGSNGLGGACVGLLNLPGITVNTTVITQSIGSMTPAQLKAFSAQLIEAYRSNCNRSAWPTCLIIPESDYNSLASQASPDFPIKSTLELLEEAFKLITRNKNFKILPLAYADAAYSGYSYQQYVLMNYDEDSVAMHIPVDFTNTLANSLDNFHFTSVGYGEFTGVQAYRPLEIMYFQYPA